MKLANYSLIGSLFLLLFLTGCSNKKKNASPQKTEPVTHHVTMEQMKFQPAELKIHKGDTVIWTNKGIVVHNVTEEHEQAWTSDSIAVGESWKMVPDKSFDYFCSIHPTMKGKITVE